MSLSAEIGLIGNAGYFYYIDEKKGVTNDYDLVLQAKDVKQAVEELKDEIGKTLEEGINRNGVLPRDWAMDRINDVIDKIFGDKFTSQAVKG